MTTPNLPPCRHGSIFTLQWSRETDGTPDATRQQVHFTFYSKSQLTRAIRKSRMLRSFEVSLTVESTCIQWAPLQETPTPLPIDQTVIGVVEAN